MVRLRDETRREGRGERREQERDREREKEESKTESRHSEGERSIGSPSMFFTLFADVNGAEKVTKAQQIIAQMPLANRRLLGAILQFCQKIIAKQSVNKVKTTQKRREREREIKRVERKRRCSGIVLASMFTSLYYRWELATCLLSSPQLCFTL